MISPSGPSSASSARANPYTRPLPGASTPPATAVPTHTDRGVDRVELSELAVEYARDAEVRGERIHTVRQQIARGEYDTPERLDAALDKMIDDVVAEG